MLERKLRLLRRRRSPAELYWLNSDIAIGRVRRADAWASVYSAGVRALVDLREAPDDLGPVVRASDIRYLRFCPDGALVPSAEELQIVAGWVRERIAQDGRVLIQDAQSRFNDGLVAVAALIKGGLPAHLALLALRRTRPNNALDSYQHAELVRFAAAQTPEA